MSVEWKKGAVSLLKNVQKVAWVYKTEKSLWLESVISKGVLKKWLYWHNIIIWSCGDQFGGQNDPHKLWPTREQPFDQLISHETTISAFGAPHAHPVKVESNQLFLSWANTWLSTETQAHFLLDTDPRNRTHKGSACKERKIKNPIKTILQQLYTCQKYTYYKSFTLCCSFANPLLPHQSWNVEGWCWPSRAHHFPNLS